MGIEQDSSSQKIADMTTHEKLAAMVADPAEYYRRATEEERPRAEQQVGIRLQRLHRLGREVLEGSES